MSVSLINIITILACILGGMMGLILSMERHAKASFPQGISKKYLHIFYCLGWFFLCIALYLSIAEWGVGIGLTAWFGILTVIVGLIIFTQSYRPQIALNMALVLIFFALGLQFFRFNE